MQMDWETLFAQLTPGFELPFLELIQAKTVLPKTNQQSEFLDALKAAPINNQREMLVDFVRQQLAKVLGLSSFDAIDLEARLFDLGLDSLMAIELNNRFEVNLGCTLSQTVISNYPTVAMLADYLLEEVLGQVSVTPNQFEVSQITEILEDEQLDDLLTELENMSDEEVQSRL